MMQTKNNVFQTALLLVILLPGIYVRPARAQNMPAVPANHLVRPESPYTITFSWQGDSVHAQWEPYAALLLPVQLPDCPQQFYMQFDLGASYSMFYRDKIEKLRRAYPGALAPVDTGDVIRQYTFRVGEMPVMAREIAVKPFGGPVEDEGGMQVIGTIGADLIEGSVTVIDYPRREIFIGPDLPAGLEVRGFVSDLVLAGRRVLLPAVIQHKKTMLFFDTGSSAFELLTDKQTFDALASPGAVPTQYEVWSWDRALTAHTAPTTDSLEMASRKMPIVNVTYMAGASAAQIEQMKKIGIGGMTGNKLFINHRLVLDMRRRQFAILEAVH